MAAAIASLMLTWIIFGFLLGLQHALEADHIAAVASIAAGKKGFRPIVRHGAMWGMGHALTLGAFGGAVYALKLTLDDRLASGLEFAVGVMLVLLGGRVHLSAGRATASIFMFTATGRAGAFPCPQPCGRRQPTMPQQRPCPRAPDGQLGAQPGRRHDARAGGIGGTGGADRLDGQSVPLGLAFMLLFGLGSIAGMAVFSAVIAVPLSLTAKTLTWASRALQALRGRDRHGLRPPDHGGDRRRAVRLSQRSCPG